MTNALKKQLCYGGGTLAGWLLAKLLGAKEAVPYTILGGLTGFAIGDDLTAETPKPPGLAGPKRKRKKAH